MMAKQVQRSDLAALWNEIDRLWAENRLLRKKIETTWELAAAEIGALHIISDNLGGTNWELTTTGTFTDTPLSISLTPKRNVWCVGLLRGLAMHSATNAECSFRILSSELGSPASYFSRLHPTAVSWVPFVLWGDGALSGGTNYTLTVQGMMNTAGTLTLHGATVYTEFSVFLLSKSLFA